MPQRETAKERVVQRLSESSPGCWNISWVANSIRKEAEKKQIMPRHAIEVRSVFADGSAIVLTDTLERIAIGRTAACRIGLEPPY